jgi:hypothetical protein
VVAKSVIDFHRGRSIKNMGEPLPDGGGGQRDGDLRWCNGRNGAKGQIVPCREVDL